MSDLIERMSRVIWGLWYDRAGPTSKGVCNNCTKNAARLMLDDMRNWQTPWPDDQDVFRSLLDAYAKSNGLEGE